MILKELIGQVIANCSLGFFRDLYRNIQILNNIWLISASLLSFLGLCLAVIELLFQDSAFDLL